MRPRILALLLPALLGHAPAHALPEGFRCVPEGAVLETSAGRTFRYHGADPADPSVCLSTFWDGSRRRSAYGLWNLATPNAPDGPARVATLYPFAPGRTAEVSRLGMSTSQHMSYAYRIVGERRVQVPAGAFDTWVIEMTFRYFGQPPMTTVYTSYVDKQTRITVKLDVRNEVGRNLDPSWEAVRITR